MAHSPISHSTVSDRFNLGYCRSLSNFTLLGKKQLNQLMTFLDKGGAKEMGTRSGNDALRSVRAKREADEAGAYFFFALIILSDLPQTDCIAVVCIG